MRTLCQGRPGNMDDLLPILDSPALAKVTDHVWCDLHSGALTWYLISDSGKALAIDYGYHAVFAFTGYSAPEKRRVLLHGLEDLKRRFGIDHPEAVLVSHFHDDHVCGIPILQRLYGTECWAPDNFADLLAHPEAHCFPCCWPVPMEVNRRLPADGTFQWEEFTIRLHPMTGHTRFSALICFEADGKRFAVTGDQYFFLQGPGQFADNVMQHNYVYRNGAMLNSYVASGKLLLDWRPDFVLPGHDTLGDGQPPVYRTDEHFFRLVYDWGRQYRDWHKQAMVLGDDEAHFDLDSWGGWIWPYRVHLAEPQTAELTVTVRNPLPTAAELRVRLVGPAGWTGQEAELSAGPRQEASCTLHIEPPGPCRRQPVAAELIVNGQTFGQVAEALITAGYEEF